MVFGNTWECIYVEDAGRIVGKKDYFGFKCGWLLARILWRVTLVDRRCKIQADSSSGYEDPMI